MTLAEFLRQNRGRFPRRGTVGVETDWLHLCDIESSTGCLWAGDPYLANEEDGCVLSVPVGSYRVEVKGVDYSGSQFLSRLRVFLSSAAPVSVGPQVGEAGTDSAQIAVCDIRAFDAAAGNDNDAVQARIESEVQRGYGVFSLGGASMAFVPSGLGDGTGPVFSLLHDRTPVGMELEFIEPGAPFE